MLKNSLLILSAFALMGSGCGEARWQAEFKDVCVSRAEDMYDGAGKPKVVDYSANKDADEYRHCSNLGYELSIECQEAVSEAEQVRARELETQPFFDMPALYLGSVEIMESGTPNGSTTHSFLCSFISESGLEDPDSFEDMDVSLISDF